VELQQEVETQFSTREVVVTLPRCRISWLMAIVALVALDMGLIRVFVYYRVHSSALLSMGAVPMANVLVVGWAFGRRYPVSRFVFWFEVVGAIAPVAFVTIAPIYHWQLTTRYLNLGIDAYLNTFGHELNQLNILYINTIMVFMLCLPHLGIALIGGFVGSYFGSTSTELPSS